MGVEIINHSELCNHGNAMLREDALLLLAKGIEAVDPGIKTRELIKLENAVLTVKGKSYRLDRIGKIYFVGTGKGSFPIAAELENILGDYLVKGILAVKKGEKRRLRKISIRESGHPVPDENSIKSAVEIVSLLNEVREGDIVFAAITGGATSMTVLPPEGISLNDIRLINEMLLKSGAVISEMNTVRRHLCQLKGGKLVSLAQPAEIITLTLDTVSDDIMPWPDMCKPDPTTFKDAFNVLKKYGLTGKTPESILSYFRKGVKTGSGETLKNLDSMRHTLVSVGNPAAACNEMYRQAKKMKYHSYILGTHIEGESRDVGIFLSGITDEIIKNNRPFKTPCVIISGGETTVTINGGNGSGGPNMETVLSFAIQCKSLFPWCFAAVDSDGTDGPTRYAGAIADNYFYKELGKGMDPEKYLRNHDSGTLLKRTGNIIETGHTGTNVMNLRILIIGEPNK